MRSSIAVKEEIARPLGFVQGMFLQLLNAKALIMGLTIYSTFLVGLPQTLWWRTASASFFTALVITALALYSLFGLFLFRILRSPRLGKAINALFAAALVYTTLALLWPLGAQLL